MRLSKTEIQYAKRVVTKTKVNSTSVIYTVIVFKALIRPVEIAIRQVQHFAGMWFRYRIKRNISKRYSLHLYFELVCLWDLLQHLWCHWNRMFLHSLYHLLLKPCVKLVM
jgi:hypothetical protein